MDGIRGNAVGEMRFDGELVPPRSATEYFQQSCYVGHEPADPGRHQGRARPGRASTASCGAATTRTRRAPAPSPASTCARWWATSQPEQIQQILAGNAAKLYNFDLDALRPAADQFGPTVARDRAAADRAARGRQPGPAALGEAAQGRQLVSRQSAGSADPFRPLPGRFMSCGRGCGEPVENALFTGITEVFLWVTGLVETINEL